MSRDAASGQMVRREVCVVAEAEGGASRQYVKRGVAVWIGCRLLGDGLGIEVSHRGGMSCMSIRLRKNTAVNNNHDGSPQVNTHSHHAVRRPLAVEAACVWSSTGNQRAGDAVSAGRRCRAPRVPCCRCPWVNLNLVLRPRANPVRQATSPTY